MWGAFGGRGLGDFHDIDQLTMFADYRVPVTLAELGILSYSPELLRKVVSHSAWWIAALDAIAVSSNMALGRWLR